MYTHKYRVYALQIPLDGFYLSRTRGDGRPAQSAAIPKGGFIVIQNGHLSVMSEEEFYARFERVDGEDTFNGTFTFYDQKR
jgi:hypothetical protein